ncbi:MAG: hypothetical protein FWC50_05255 [Planctomycetaceae bacterium]|nr:hypothetical protein [Planctomycetaceae bacterium]
MQGYWIETECFAAPTVPLTRDQYAQFYEWCTSKARVCNEFSERDCYELIILDYTQEWEKRESNEVENGFWQKVEDDENYLIDCHPYTLVKIFPEEATKKPPHYFARKRGLYQKIIDGRASVKKSDKADWNLLKDFLDLADYARENYDEHGTQGESPPEIHDDISTFLKNKFRKEVPTLPALPADGESNGDWITLSGFIKSNHVPENTVRTNFSSRRESIIVEHNGCKYGKSETKNWKGLVWCQIPEEMKSKTNDSGYFILRKSLSEPIVTMIEKKYKSQ